MNHPDTSARQRAEAWSLLRRNLKARWRDTWKDLPPERRRAHALDAPLLMQAYEAYAKGFRQDLNHFYSGLNALAMLTIVQELATALPDIWADRFTDEDEAGRKLSELQAQRQPLVGAVELSIHGSKQSLEQAGAADPWVGVSWAEFHFLTVARPGPVGRAYKDALEGQPDFIGGSVRQQLRLDQELDILTEKVLRVLAVLAPAVPTPEAPAQPRAILFTGHQVDAPGRDEPPFPASMESRARHAIREIIQRESTGPGGAVGLAGAASGGDILFHEVCTELGVPTTRHLAFPPEQYVKESVAPAGGDWIRRFWVIKDRFPASPIVSRSTDLPGWLHARGNYSIWQRNNLWMLNEALAAGARNVTVLALWNGKGEDTPGGTADMITIARGRGAETRVLDTNAIFKP